VECWARGPELYFRNVYLLLRGLGAILRNLVSTPGLQNSHAAASAAIQALCNQNFIEQIANKAPVARVDYTFDQPLAGEGWFPREGSDGRYWRFTGPGDRATIILPKVSADLKRLRLTIFHAVTPEHLARLRVLVNGVELEQDPCQAGALELLLPQCALTRAAFTEICFQTLPGVRPGSQDDRQIGIAFSRIEIF
jgi:hypothetical protein